MLLAQILWLAFPVLVANAIHVLVIRFNLLSSLKHPIDAGATCRGKRLFGDNKTWRGAYVNVVFAILAAFLQGNLLRVESLELFDYGATSMHLLGLLLGAGFVLAELPNSFVKRQWGVGPGQRGSLVFILGDQLDSVIGCLVLLSLLWVPPLAVWLAIALLATGLHIGFNCVFVAVGIKERVF